MGADFRGVRFLDNGNSLIGVAMANAISANDPILKAVSAPGMADLGSYNTKGLSFGGFVGYNYQIDDVVLGFELNFNRAGFDAGSGSTQSHTYIVTNNNGTYSATNNGVFKNTCTVPAGPPPPTTKLYCTTINTLYGTTDTVSDYGTLRARGGWAYGNFLPYVVAAVSVAQVNSSQTGTVNYFGTDVTPGSPPGPPISQSYSASAANHGKYFFGFAAGLGVDYALLQNVFLRGEVEYLQLGSPSDKLNITSVHAGLGLKF
jgi:opacity protein-like surface antigen